MGSGKPSGRPTEPGGVGARRAGLAPASGATLSVFVCALLLSLASCVPSRSFEELLSRIDTAGGTERSGLFKEASRKAGSARDQLRLVSRARSSNEPGLYHEVVERAFEAFPNHPSLAFVAAASRLESGHPVAALELFSGPLAPTEAPELYSLAWIAMARQALRTGKLPPDPGPEVLGLVAQTLGSPEPLVVAAAFSLGRGDSFMAERYLDVAATLGAVAPALAWELGRFDLVLASPLPEDPEPGSPETARSARATELARRADAALLSGRVELAKRYYLELITEAPSSSWKPWEALALLAEGWRPAPSTRRGELAIAAGPADAEEVRFRDAQLASRFPDVPEATLARADRLSRDGRAVEALGLLATLGNRPDALLASAAARLRGGDPSRAALDALAAIEFAPEDPAVLDAAISMLVRAGEPWKAVLAARRARAFDRAPPGAWFASALEATAEGRLEEAIGILETAEASEPGYAPTASLALLLREAGRRREAAERWSLAVRESVDVKDRVRFLVEESRDRIATGDAAKARAALSVALDLDPGSIEAAGLLASARGK